MSISSRKYAFDWSVLGNDMKLARPGLGGETKVEVYRLLQFTLRDILEQRYGTKETDAIFLEAGTLAGKEFFKNYCSEAKDVPSLAKLIQQQFKDLRIGIVRFEIADVENLTFQLTVDEDLDCSGLPDTHDQVCVYDEGFIKGILDSFTGFDFTVEEIDCWCSGARTCRFKAVVSR